MESAQTGLEVCLRPRRRNDITSPSEAVWKKVTKVYRDREEKKLVATAETAGSTYLYYLYQGDDQAEPIHSHYRPPKVRYEILTVRVPLLTGGHMMTNYNSSYAQQEEAFKAIELILEGVAKANDLLSTKAAGSNSTAGPRRLEALLEAMGQPYNRRRIVVTELRARSNCYTTLSLPEVLIGREWISHPTKLCGAEKGYTPASFRLVKLYRISEGGHEEEKEMAATSGKVVTHTEECNGYADIAAYLKYLSQDEKKAITSWNVGETPYVSEKMEIVPQSSYTYVAPKPTVYVRKAGDAIGKELLLKQGRAEGTEVSLVANIGSAKKEPGIIESVVNFFMGEPEKNPTIH